ncbi:hypothetical protein X975_17233, partial [Stegodyphus mimosarum]
MLTLHVLEQNFLTQVNEATEKRKLQLLCNFVFASIYQYINDSQVYDNAINILASLYILLKEIKYLPATVKHLDFHKRMSISIHLHEHLQILKQLRKDYEFKSVTAEEYKNEYIRDAFIQGLKKSTHSRMIIGKYQYFVRKRLMIKLEH